jgi:hypothetical protein
MRKLEAEGFRWRLYKDHDAAYLHVDGVLDAHSSKQLLENAFIKRYDDGLWVGRTYSASAMREIAEVADVDSDESDDD